MAVVELESSRLPLEPPAYVFWRENRPKYSKAYDRTLRAEFHAAEQAEVDPTNQDAQDNVNSARIAGYLLLELFDRRTTLGEGPCKALRKSILSEVREPAEDEHDVVFSVGRWYHDHLMRLFLPSSKGYPQPYISCMPISSTLKEGATKEYIAAYNGYQNIRSKVLARDGFRCVLTSTFDLASLNNNPGILRECDKLGSRAATIDSCYIIGESTQQSLDAIGGRGDDAVTSKTDSVITAVSVLTNLGLNELAQKLARDGIHNLRNVLSLDSTSHAYFNMLLLWFEGTDRPNCYHVCVSDSIYAAYFKGRGHFEPDHGRPCITFSQSEESTQPPDLQLLTLHAVCARVAHMSGVVKALNQSERDIEDAMSSDE